MCSVKGCSVVCVRFTSYQLWIDKSNICWMQRNWDKRSREVLSFVDEQLVSVPPQPVQWWFTCWKYCCTTRMAKLRLRINLIFFGSLTFKIRIACRWNVETQIQVWHVAIKNNINIRHHKQSPNIFSKVHFYFTEVKWIFFH